MSDDLLRDLRELPPPLDIPHDFFDGIMAKVRRRRRARRVASATVALVVAFVGIVIGLNVSSNSATERIVPITPSPSSAPTIQPTPGPSVTPASTPPAWASSKLGFVPVSVSFVSPSLGWAYGPNRPMSSQGIGPFVGELAVTYDGGQHWSTLPAPGSEYSASGGASSVLFVHSYRGYLYGDGLFTSTDGGVHWQRITAPGSVSHVAVAGDKLYVTAMTCPASAPLCGIYDLYVGQLDGSGFERVPIGEYNQTQLSSLGSRVFLYGSPAGVIAPVGPYRATVSSSADGVHWSSFSAPCEADGADSGSLAAFSDSGLALVCGSSPSAGIQGKTAYVSTDSGAHWTQQGADSSLPNPGYVGPLAAADANTWVLAEQRGGLLVTHDAGATWRTATTERLGQGTDGWTQVVFADPQHAVAVPSSFYAGGLLLSSDAGDSWTAVTFPP
jgi:hypothetical protein